MRGAGSRRAVRLIDAYREYGHGLGDLDPLKLNPPGQSLELLEPAAFGLTESDLDHAVYNRDSDGGFSSLRELIAVLQVDLMYGRSASSSSVMWRIRKWLAERWNRCEPPVFDIKKKRRIVYKLNEGELFETFLHKNYVGQGEPLPRRGRRDVDTASTRSSSGLFGAASRRSSWVRPHRGRLNVLVNILNKPYGMVFNEFEGNHLPGDGGGDGDVKYHLGFTADHVKVDKQTIHLDPHGQPEPPGSRQPGCRRPDAGRCAPIPGSRPPAWACQF